MTGRRWGWVGAGVLLLASLVWAQSSLINGSRVLVGTLNFCTGGGSTNTYACSLDPVITGYITDMLYGFSGNAANTGAATINFNSLGAKTIKKWSNGAKVDLVANDIGANQRVLLQYDGTDMLLLSLPGSAAAQVPRVVSMSNATSFTPTADTADMNTQDNTQTAGTLTANNPSGTPVNGQKLTLRIKSLNVQTFAWSNTSGGYRSGTMPCPTASTGSSKTDYIGLLYNGADSKWDCVSFASGY